MHYDVIRPIAAAFSFVLVILTGFWSRHFFDDLPRTLFLITGVIAVGWISRGKHPMSKGKEQGESMVVFAILIGATILVGFVVPFFSGREITSLRLPPFLRYFGVVLFLAGLWIRHTAIRALKRQFSIYIAIQENHQLITTGIYSRIRHPIYLGAALNLIGFALVFPTLLGFLFVCVYFMLLSHRMAQEEKLMLKHFGSVYEEYITKSHRLIPHIY